MVLIEKSNKRKKSHSVKKSEIFCCVLKFKIHFLKRKSLRKRRVYADFGAVGCARNFAQLSRLTRL